MKKLDEHIKFVLTIAAYYRETLADMTVKMWAEDLADIPVDALNKVFREITEDPKITRCPLPAILKQKLKGSMPSVEDEARQITEKIWGAVSKFGHSNPAMARDYIGEVGWQLIRMQGGWSDLCATADRSQMMGTKAQWRETVTGLINQAKRVTYEREIIKNRIENTIPKINLGFTRNEM
jgi:hypothetical protein